MAIVAATLVLTAGFACSETPERSDEAFCEALAEVADLDERLSGDPEVLRRAAEDLDRLADVAPVQIAADVTVLADAVGRMSDAAERADGDTAPLDAAVRALAGDHERIERSSASISSYASSHCELALVSASPHGAR